MAKAKKASKAAIKKAAVVNIDDKNHAYYNLVNGEIVVFVSQVNETTNNAYLALPFHCEYTLTLADINGIVKGVGIWQAYNTLGVMLGLHKGATKKCKHLDECLLGLAVSEWLVANGRKAEAKKVLANNTAAHSRITPIERMISAKGDKAAAKAELKNKRIGLKALNTEAEAEAIEAEADEQASI